MEENFKEKCQQEFLKKIKTKSNYREISEYYEKNKADIDINENDADKRRPLVHAIISKNYDAVKFLLSLPDLKTDITDSVRISLKSARLVTITLRKCPR
jgi:hypothetical protein